jgi:hypothetical protein
MLRTPAIRQVTLTRLARAKSKNVVPEDDVIVEGVDIIK